MRIKKKCLEIRISEKWSGRGKMNTQGAKGEWGLLMREVIDVEES